MGRARISHKVSFMGSLKWLIYLASVQVTHVRTVLTIILERKIIMRKNNFCLEIITGLVLLLIVTGYCYGSDRLNEVLSLEKEHISNIPTRWETNSVGTIFFDQKTFHSGKYSARIERNGTEEEDYTVLRTTIPLDFIGNIIELRGWVKTDITDGLTMMFIFPDSENLMGTVVVSQELKGIIDWTQYSISLDIRSFLKSDWALGENFNKLTLGLSFPGIGKVWFDDVEVLIDNKPLSEVPKTTTPIDRDHEFDEGSKISVSSLTKIQTENLITLGKVWGFLKYHHPVIVQGERHWDYDLFRVLPGILAAADRNSANTVLKLWIDLLGEVKPCNQCASLQKSDFQLLPDVKWIENKSRLGLELSAVLQKIYTNRPVRDRQFYVSYDLAKNPLFENELAYKKIEFPDFGYQLLTLYRYWNIIEYWFPYRDVIGEDWDKILVKVLQKITLTKTREEYELEIAALIASINDSHALLFNSYTPPKGECQIPVSVRFIENSPVVIKTWKDETNLNIGDEFLELDGIPVKRLVRGWSPYYSASNEWTRLRDIARVFTRGACGESSAKIRRDKKNMVIKVQRVKAEYPNISRDLPGEAFQVLRDNVAYLKMSTATVTDALEYFEKASKTRGWVIDLRNYPANDVFPIVSGFFKELIPFVYFTIPDITNPGSFRWLETMVHIYSSDLYYYSGKLVILVDEVTQSNAELVAMSTQVRPGVVVIGGKTAGTDGNISKFALPFGLVTRITGVGVFRPDKRPTQRVGIVPDIMVNPSIEGIKEGKDEVLEKAIDLILDLAP